MPRQANPASWIESAPHSVIAFSFRDSAKNTVMTTRYLGQLPGRTSQVGVIAITVLLRYEVKHTAAVTQ